MVNIDTCCRRRSLQHASPLPKDIGWIFLSGRMTVIPFFARYFGADAVGHHGAVMGQIADGKSVGLETTGSGAQDNAFGLEKMDLGLIQAETCRPCDATFFPDKMGEHDPFHDRDVSFLHGFVKGIGIERRVEKSPFFELLDPGQGVFGHLPGEDGVIGSHGREGDLGSKRIKIHCCCGWIIGKDSPGKGGLARGTESALGNHKYPGPGIMGFDCGKKACNTASYDEHIGFSFSVFHGIDINFWDIGRAFGGKSHGRYGGKSCCAPGKGHEISTGHSV